MVRCSAAVGHVGRGAEGEGGDRSSDVWRSRESRVEVEVDTGVEWRKTTETRV